MDEVEFNLGGRQVVMRKRIATQPGTIGFTRSKVRTLD